MEENRTSSHYFHDDEPLDWLNEEDEDLELCRCGCGQIVEGHGNRRFVDIEHKIRYNNRKSSLIHAALSKEIKILINNFRVLEKYYSLYPDEQILLSPLLSKGFDPNGFSHSIKEAETGEEYRIIVVYAYRISRSNQYITIKKFENYGRNIE